MRITNGSTIRTHQNTLAEGGKRDSIIKIDMSETEHTGAKCTMKKREKKDYKIKSIGWRDSIAKHVGKILGRISKGILEALFREIFLREKKDIF